MTVTADVTDGMLLDLVRGAVATVMELKAEQLDADTRLVEDVSADSLAMIEIVEIVEEQLRARGSAVRIDDDSLARVLTLGDVVAAFAQATRAGAPL
jgi:acyl carrier protein